MSSSGGSRNECFLGQKPEMESCKLLAHERGAGSSEEHPRRNPGWLPQDGEGCAFLRASGRRVFSVGPYSVTAATPFRNQVQSSSISH